MQDLEYHTKLSFTKRFQHTTNIEKEVYNYSVTTNFLIAHSYYL